MIEAPDVSLIRAHVEMINQLAEPVAEKGKLVIASFGEDPDQPHPSTGKPGWPLPPTVVHAEIGDVETTVQLICNLGTAQHRNIYTPLAVFMPDLPGGKKGYEKDIVALLGLVADFDDANAARWAERLPLAPNFVLETSTGRFQAFYFFEKPEAFASAKPVAVRLKAHAGCDHGTADCSHVWRIGGTLNWPNGRKVAAGRPREPQLVRVVKPWGGERISLEELAAALPEAKPGTTEQRPEPKPASADEPVVGGTEPTVELLLSLLPDNLRARISQPDTGDRSKSLFYVIKALAKRGLNEPTIRRIIEAHPEGIGAKYAGRSDLDQEVARVLSKSSRRDAAAAEGARARGAKPLVQIVGGALTGIIDQAELHLLASDHGIFQRGDFIVRPALERIPIADKRKTLGMRLVPVKVLHMVERFTFAVDFQRFDARTDDWVSIDCPPKIAATYLERIGVWRLPVLTGITNTPTLRSDGSLLEQPGYDERTGILYDPLGVTFPPVPIEPTKDQAFAALGILKDPIETFPFVDDAGRSVALSGILTSIIRRSIPRAPMHAYTAPIMGSGKSKLVDVASMIATGHEAPVIAQGKTEEEMEKRLGAALIAGDPIISFDNCEHPLGGELLCQATTQSIMNIRILGKSVNVAVANNAVFFATGNNLVVIGDMTRRTIMSLLDPKCERPELRSFDTDPIETIRCDRPRYVLAALTVLGAFHVAGRPRQTVPLGSFDDWSWVRDSLVWLGEADPCATMERARAEDPKLGALSNVIHQWGAIIGTQRTSAKKLIDTATDTGPTQGYSNLNPREFLHPDFREALLVVAGDGGVINSRRLGIWLASVKGRIVDGSRIIDDGIVAGITQWRLERKE